MNGKITGFNFTTKRQSHLNIVLFFGVKPFFVVVVCVVVKMIRMIWCFGVRADTHTHIRTLIDWTCFIAVLFLMGNKNAILTANLIDPNLFETVSCIVEFNRTIRIRFETICLMYGTNVANHVEHSNERYFVLFVCWCVLWMTAFVKIHKRYKQTNTECICIDRQQQQHDIQPFMATII